MAKIMTLKDLQQKSRKPLQKTYDDAFKHENDDKDDSSWKESASDDELDEAFEGDVLSGSDEDELDSETGEFNKIKAGLSSADQEKALMKNKDM